MGGGITAGTLYYLAKKYNNPNDIRTTDYKPKQQITNIIDVKSRFESYLPAAHDHPYIKMKQGWPDDLKMVPEDSHEKINGKSIAGALVVPCFEGNQIKSLQFITVKDKLNLPKYTFDLGYFMQGSDTRKIYIVEGISKVWAVIEATGYSAVCTFGVDRTEKVVKLIKSQFPQSEIIICADRGQESRIKKIASKEKVKAVFMPEEYENNSDINDLLLKTDRQTVKNLLEKSISFQIKNDDALDKINALKKIMRDSTESISKITAVSKLIDGIAYAGHHTYLYGASGTYKTTFVTALCLQALEKNPSIEVHYWGFDVSLPYSIAVTQDLYNKRFELFINQTIKDMEDFYSIYLENGVRLDNVIIVLDTFKFFTKNINDKKANQNAMHFIKSICKQGAAWISIGHSNKDGMRESGTAEIEQDGDGILRIEIVKSQNKCIGTIKKAGRCRWGEKTVTIETTLEDVDNENPHLFYSAAIKNAHIVDNKDAENLIKINENYHELELISEIIKNFSNQFKRPIIKTELLAQIKESKEIDLSVRQLEVVLKAGENRFWHVENDKKNNNRQLFSSLA